jgi:capsular exopolysaccharide synthesis family protein
MEIQRVVLNHKFLLLFCLSAGIVGAWFVYRRTPPRYASSAKVLVAKNEVRIPVEEAENVSRPTDPLNTHVELITTPVILENAVRDYELWKPRSSSVAATAPRGSAEGRTPSDAATPEQIAAAVEAIGGALRASRSQESDEIMNLSFTSEDPVKCQEVLNAVVNAYIDFVRNSHQSLNRETIKLITEARDGLMARLSEKERDYARLREQSSLLWEGDEITNIYQQRLKLVESQRAQLRIERSQIQGDLDAIRDALARGESREVILMMANRSASDVNVDDLEAKRAKEAQDLANLLLPLLVEEQTLLQTHGPQHPTIVSLRKRIAVTRQLIQEAAGLTRSKTMPIDFINVYVNALEQRTGAIDRKLAQLNTLWEETEQAALASSADENKIRAVQEDIARSKGLFDVLREKLQARDLIKDGDLLAVEVVAAPKRGRRVAPNRTEYLTYGGILGLLAGLALATLLEVSDKGFKSPDHITRHMSLPVLGHVSIVPDHQSQEHVGQLDKSLVAFYRPRSRWAEAYRAIRVPLLFAAKHHNVKVVQITSPDPGDGKSTVAANLAIAMATSGKRCLLIDADLRRPRVHKLFAADNRVGLASVIRGDVQLREAIVRCDVDNLELLTSGPQRANPAELLLAHSFEAALAALREEYDFVFIDTPPVLAVTEPSAVASKVDGVLLVLQITRRAQLHAKRAQETLAMVQSRLLGIVVNGMGNRESSTYSAGVYAYYAGRYGSGKSSYSPYAGSDGDGRYNTYYTDPDAAGAPAQSNGRHRKPCPAATS